MYPQYTNKSKWWVKRIHHLWKHLDMGMENILDLKVICRTKNNVYIKSKKLAA